MRTLLLADDSVTVQRVIALTFAAEAFQIVTVSDGQAAIDRIASQPPDIVLAGTSMPNVNGYEVARFVRSQASLQAVPVLLLTGAFETVDAARLDASGASGVIEKPLEPTIVISRVKELLGMTREPGPAPTGRLATSVGPPAAKKARPLREVPKPAVSAERKEASAPPQHAPASAWDELKEASGLGPGARSVESSGASGRADYFDSLDSAFDSLDKHLAGRPDEEWGRNPAPPLARQATAVDPRAPRRRPQPSPLGVTPPNPIFEVDDEWFAENDKATADRLDDQKELAAEMGIHDVELPETPDAVNTVASAVEMDFDFGLDDETRSAVTASRPLAPEPAALEIVPPEAEAIDASLDAAHVEEPPAKPAPRAASSPPITAVPAPPVLPPEPAAAATPPEPEAAPPEPVAARPEPKAAPPEPEPTLPEPASPAVMTAALELDVLSAGVADDFAALLAFEQGEAPLPVPAVEPPPPVVVQVVTPEITPEMIDQIAARVAACLNEGPFADQMRAAMTTTVRDTVRTVVSETSERLVRDEIARVTAQTERDAQ